MLAYGSESAGEEASGLTLLCGWFCLRVHKPGLTETILTDSILVQ